MVEGDVGKMEVGGWIGGGGCEVRGGRGKGEVVLVVWWMGGVVVRVVSVVWCGWGGGWW